MKLAIDIGNTSIRCGIFKNKKNIKKSYFCSSSIFMEFKKFINQINNLNISRIVISSVVPKLNSPTEKLLNKNFPSCPIIFINLNISNINTSVPEPSTIGADRLCNIYAATKLYSTPIIIIDFGTATTYDIVNIEGVFIGGIIAPGVLTSAKYLINDAALLPKTDLRFPKKIVGTTTKENIQSGIMFGAIAQIEGIVAKIIKETNTNYSIIITGGFSSTLSEHLPLNHIQDIDLTLKGMIAIDELNF